MSDPLEDRSEGSNGIALLRTDGPVATHTISRPDRRNAISTMFRLD
ncbi:MAG: hypothetical protein ACR2H7_04750 [Actinomycetota bacterium]